MSEIRLRTTISSPDQGTNPPPEAVNDFRRHGVIGDLRFQAADPGSHSTPPRSAQFRPNDPRDFMADELIAYKKSPSDPVTRVALRLQAPLPTNVFNTPRSRGVDQQAIGNLEYRLYTSDDNTQDKLDRELQAANRNKNFPEPPEGRFAPRVSTPTDPQSTSGVIDLRQGYVPPPGTPEDPEFAAKPNLYDIVYRTLPSGAGEANLINSRGPSKAREDRSLSDHFDISAGGQKVGFHLFVIGDGHGGSRSAEHVQKGIKAALKENLTRYNPNGVNQLGMFNGVKQGFVQLDRSGGSGTEGFQHDESGSTVNAILIQGKELTCANLGDSRAIYITPTTTTQLSDDAKPNDVDKAPQPRFRNGVESRGGHIFRGRVNDKLATTRSVGDPDLEGAISARPKLTQIALPDTAHRAGHYVVQVSDGITDVMSTDTIAERVRDGHEKGYTPALIAALLVKEARLLGSVDDLTAQVIPLDRLQEPQLPTDTNSAA